MCHLVNLSNPALLYLSVDNISKFSNSRLSYSWSPWTMYVPALCSCSCNCIFLLLLPAEGGLRNKLSLNEDWSGLWKPDQCVSPWFVLWFAPTSVFSELPFLLNRDYGFLSMSFSSYTVQKDWFGKNPEQEGDPTHLVHDVFLFKIHIGV